MQCYFNDILAGIILNAMMSSTTKYNTRWGLCLTIVAGVFWEYIAPLFNSRSVSDPLDIIAYITGFIIFTIIERGIQMSKCSKCGTENPDSARFCINCGYDLSTAFCPVCGQPVHNWDRKCKMCNSEWDDKWNVTKNRPPKHPELERAGNDFDFYVTVILVIVFIVCVAWGIIQWLAGQF